MTTLRLLARLLVASVVTLTVTIGAPATVHAANGDGGAGTLALPHCTDYTKLFDLRYNLYVNFPTIGYDTADAQCILTQGDANAGVFVLQDALRRCYGQDIAVDAIYGPRTEEAVKNVQRFHGITVDGDYGPETRDAMTWPKYTLDGSYVGCWL